MTYRSTVRVEFFDPDTLAGKSMGAAYLVGLEGSGKHIAGKIGNGSVDIPVDELARMTGAYTFPQAHDICVVYSVQGIGGAHEERIASFVIRSIKFQPGAFGQASTFNLSGPGMLYGLGKTRKYLNVGEEHSTVTANYASTVDEHYIYLGQGPLGAHRETEGMTGVEWPKWTLIKAQSFHTGEGQKPYGAGDDGMKLFRAVELAKPADEQWDVGDDIYIVWQISPQQTFRTSITAINSTDYGDTYYRVQTLDPMEHLADVESDDGPPMKYYPVFTPHVWKGDPISIQMDDASWHDTRVSAEARYDGVKLEEGVPDTVAIGNTVKWWNAREPNTIDDITRIMDTASGWTVPIGVSSKGSAHFVDRKGVDTLSLLSKTAENTGDYFYASQAVASVPERTLQWKTSSPATGLTLMQPSSGADAITKLAAGTYAFVHSIAMESRDLPITRIAASGGVSDDVNVDWNMGHASETPYQGLLWRHQIEQVDDIIKEYVNGVWRLRNNTSSIVVEEQVTWDDIQPKSAAHNSKIEAANILQARANLVLYNKRTTEYKYNITTVLPPGAEINPGETIILDYTDNEWDIASEVLYIAEFEHFVQRSGKLMGVRQTRMILSTDGPYPRVTGATAVAGALKGRGGASGFGIGVGGVGGTPTDDPTLPQELITLGAVIPTGSLTLSGQELSFVLNINDGLDVSTNNVSLTAPTVNLSSVTTNAVAAGGHTHAIDTTADPISNPLSIVATDANSRTGFSGLGIGQLADADELQVATTLSFIGAQTINTTSGDLAISPAGGNLDLDAHIIFQGTQNIVSTSGDIYIQPYDDLYLNPSGDVVRISSASVLRADSWTSGFLGNNWGITYEGQADFRGIQADELRVKIFSADHTLVSNGSHYVPAGMGEVYDNSASVPSVSSSTTITFYDDPVIGAAAIFRDGAKGFFRITDSTAGGLYYALVWGTVTSYSDNADGSQDWTFTTGSLGAAVGGDTIPQGAVFVSWGLEGMGVWSVTTNDITSGPYAQVQTWSGSDPWTAANRTTHVRLGDLAGIDDGKHQYGLYAGMGTDKQHLMITDTKAEFQGIPMSFYQGTNDSAYLRMYALELVSDVDGNVYPDTDILYGPTGETLVRSTGIGTWESHIDNSPDTPGTDYLSNVLGMRCDYAHFALGDLSHTLATLKVRSYIYKGSFVDDFMSISVRVWDGSEVYGWLTEEAVIMRSDMLANGAGAVFEYDFENIVTGNDLAWAQAQIVVIWTYNVAGGSEVIRIEPEVIRAGQGPYIAMGSPIPVGGWANDGDTNGIYIGRRANGEWALRVGGSEDNTTDASMIYTSGSGLYIFSANKTTPVLHFDNSGNAYVQQTLTLNTVTGKLVAGDLTLHSGGVYMNPGNAAAWEIDHAFAYRSGATTVSGMYGKLYSGSNELIVQTNAITGYAGEVFLYAQGGASKAASIDLSALADDGGGVHVGLDMDTTDDEAVFTAGYLIAGSGLRVYDGIMVGTPFETVGDGEIILQQASGDGNIIQARSTDLDVTGQGLADSENFFELAKAHPTNGGTRFITGSDGNLSWYVIASVNTATTTQTTSSAASIMFDGLVDNAAMGSTANIMSVRNQYTNALIIRADGHIFSNYATSMTVFDGEDDDLILRELEYQISPKDILQRGMDRFINRNGDNLRRLGITQDGKMMDNNLLSMLQIGAITQHGDKLRKLEEKITEQGELIIALLEKLGMANNPGTIIENTA